MNNPRVSAAMSIAAVALMVMGTDWLLEELRVELPVKDVERLVIEHAHPSPTGSLTGHAPVFSENQWLSMSNRLR